jgi:hypothetical protein
MEIIENLGGKLYVYCTDFIINMSNLLGISYYEFNFIIFCIVFPFLTLFIGIRFLYLNYSLYKIKKSTL